MKKNMMALAILASFAAPALAEGVYATLDVGQSTIKDGCAGTAPLSCSESGTAFRIGVGYPLHPNFAIEAGYSRPGSLKASDGIDSAEAKPTVLAATVVGSIPLQSGFALLGKLGISRASTDFSGSASTPGTTTHSGLAWGIGAQYEINPQIAVRAQYELLGRVLGQNGENVDLTMFSGGVVFKF